MWNGLVSWGGVETGQKEFLKQNCPINRNTYDLKRICSIFYLPTWETAILLSLKRDRDKTANICTKQTFFILQKLLNHNLLVVRSVRTELRLRLRT